MDSNNGLNHIGIGEREGRIYSNIVKRRNFGLIHGIGRYLSINPRSGDVTELQPKAVGSSLLLQLAQSVVKNLINSIGMTFVKSLLILPFATGMAITLSFLTLKAEKPVNKIHKQ
jgi:O-phospho-L-seryl-tRNASec:L-selenocysteinyl-tRNA synthase